MTLLAALKAFYLEHLVVAIWTAASRTTASG